MSGLLEHPEPGAKLNEGGELLYRNVRSAFYQNGHVSSQTFEPAPVDKELLSVDRASLTSPKEAFERFLRAKEAKSAGVLAVTVEECATREVPALENPLPDNAAHAVLDFRGRNNSQTKKRAHKLRDSAVARGWLVGPKE